MMNTKKTSEKIARQLQVVRTKRVEFLKSQIATGSYEIKNTAIAKALLH